MRVYGAGLSDVGLKRSYNEDAFFLDNELGLYVVADGMGGHASGDVASSQAVDGMVRAGRDKIERAAAGATDEQSLREAIRVMESAVQAATYMVFGMAQHDPSSKGMGTTLSAMIICGQIGITAQVGDSRVYQVRAGQAAPLTEDHTLVAWQVKQGIITEAEAAVSPHRNVITRAVGSREYVQVDTRFFGVAPGDAFVLCSDGLHGDVQDIEIPAIVALGPDQAVQRFIDVANERGGKDNITAVVVQVSE